MTPPDRHIFKRYDNEMKHLHGLVIRMGKLAVSQLEEAVATLVHRDAEGARRVIANDKKINDLDIAANDEIIHIIALRQPMAGDLREIIALSKIIAELERAGDEARKIAGLTLRFYADGINPQVESILQDTYPPVEPILQGICSLAEYVGSTLATVMAAFDKLNLEGALGVLQQEHKLDRRLQFGLRNLSAFMLEDSRNIDHFVDIVLGLRALERFGGHAKNIAGHIVFITHGIDVRHHGVEAIEEQLGPEWEGS